MNWFENQKRFGHGSWVVMKVRKRAKVKERLPVIVGLTRTEAIKQQVRLTLKQTDGITYEIEPSEF